ncbi:MAG TPA: methyltransferase domain-containing protein [Bryobacteraceae bacterium]|nr:methyltransferase domain-containing protein [Bryobacteraceae bacterium]
MRRLAALGGIALFAALAVSAQAVHPLTGRRIAPAMGPAGADWLDRSDREKEEAPEAALDAIGIAPGMIVADVGAGTGYISAKLARRVGPTGRVYAEDIQPEMLDRVRDNSEEAHLNNIETVLGSEADPRLPAGRIDVELLVDVYHEFSQPQKMLQALRRALRKDGRLVLLEYRKEDPSIPIRPDHKMSIAEVRTEVEAEGFRLDKVIDTLPRQHLFIFRRAPDQ